ncbi:hypothetical protein HO173_002996 [Letharia columbiana]|uniref:Uncharacterized protein n=1 Tax=Letharia columbiana TaxID=112416 RepID=A0A8H6G278_9LECA|nr:uncharacterized protein HO173_002996 [Letharia columbiana]KAF6239124.1 hypothetical protein HO173_002996 [Letharia columbiana]
MATRRIPSRAKTTPIETLHSLLTVQEADTAFRSRPVTNFLLNYDELPAWRQDNHFILTHYRPTSNSVFTSFQSLFQLHNESVNIHSHLSAAWIFFFIALSLYAFERHAVTSADTIAFLFFFSGAVTCLGISATYHTVSNHSPKINQWGNQIDYLGIVILISGSFVPSVYYGFYCEPMLQRFYWGMISTIGIACAVVSLNPKFRSPLWRSFRAGMFLGFGLSAIFPVLHGVYMYGLEQMRYSIGLDWVLLQGFLYILGAAIYAARVPERFQPGRYDIWGSSHQIFHVLITLAAMSQLIGLLTAFHHARTSSKC